MPAFAVGQTIVTGESWVDVDGLPAGTYRFQLQVEDAAGHVSPPTELVVTVTPPPPPTIRIHQPIERIPRIPDWKLPGRLQF